MANTENGRTMEFGFEEGCVMQLSRAPGTNGCDCSIEITSAKAGVKGLSLLTVKLAEVLQMSPVEVVCRLTVELFAPEDPQRLADCTAES